MSTAETPAMTPETTAMTPDLMAGMQEAVARAMHGIRDHEAMRKACERMDRMREETYRKHGLLDIGLPAIRELRDGE